MARTLLIYLFQNRRTLSQQDKNIIRFALKVSFCLLVLPGIPAFAENPSIPVLTVAYEASNQPFEGQIAVASVIKTRMAKRRQTAEQVSLAPAQFSCWKDGKPTQSRKLKDREIQTAKKAWEQAKPGEYDHYAHYSIDNYWTRKSVKSVRVGDHVFYKL